MAKLAIPQLFLWALVFQWIVQSNPYVQAATRLIISSIIVYWLLQSIWGSKKIQLPQSALPIAVLCLYLCFSAMRTPIQWLGIRELRTALVFILIMIFFVNELVSDHRIQIWENTILSVGAFLSISNIAYTASKFLEWKSINSIVHDASAFKFRFPGIFLKHPNIEAGFITLLFPIIIGRFIRTKEKTTRALLIFITSLFLVNLNFSSSRGSWVATLIGSSLTLLITGIAFLSRQKVDFKAILKNRRKLIFFVLLPLLVISWVLLALILNQMFQATGRPSLWPSRERPWSLGWQLLSQSPILGHGIGSAKVLISIDETIPPMPYLFHLHNLFLQLGVEIGVLGIILVGWLVFKIFQAIYAAFVNGTYRDRLIVAVIVGSLSSAFIHHLVDYLLAAPVYSTTIAFLVALLISISTKHSNFLKLSIRQSMVASVIGIILLIAWIYPAGSFSYSNALDDYRQNPSLDTVNRLCGVSEVYGYRPFFAFTCGRAKSELAFVSNDAQSRLEAMEAYRSALDIDPYWPIHWANLAALEWESGITVQALRHMLIALDSAPNYAVFNFNYGRMLEKGGDFETAQNYYVKAAVLEPSLLSSTKIKHTDELVGHLLASRPFEIETTANYHARIGWYYIHLNQLQDATNEFLIVIDQHHAHASARAGLAYINLKRGAIEEAHKHIRIALFSDPQPGLTQYIAGKIAYLRGNQDEGDSHFRSAIEYYEYETFSEGYYSVVYQEEYLKPDAVPFLQSVFITEQMWLDFYAYVSELDAVEPEKAQHFKEQLRKWKIE